MHGTSTDQYALVPTCVLFTTELDCNDLAGKSSNIYKRNQETDVERKEKEKKRRARDRIKAYHRRSFSKMKSAARIWSSSSQSSRVCHLCQMQVQEQVSALAQEVLKTSKSLQDRWYLKSGTDRA
jgi:hypothetical protein